MVQICYSDKELFKIAEENYRKLRLFCETLDLEGYWNEPEAFLHKSIYEMLDMYVQSVLLNLTIYCGRCRGEERRFIMDLPTENLLQCVEGGDLKEETIVVANRLMKNPPIILQLCGVRDSEKKSFFSSYFFDSLVNIMLSCSMLSQKQSPYTNKFITEFYQKNAFFLNEDQRENIIDNRYLFLKLSKERYTEMKPPVNKWRELQKDKEIEKKNNAKVDFVSEDLQNIKETKEEEYQTNGAEGNIVNKQDNPKEGQDLNKDEQQKFEKETKDNPKVVEQKDNLKEIDKKDKTIFDYSDDELIKLQQMGKLKIRAPKIKELREKQKVIRNIEDEKVENIRKEIEKINHAKKLQEILEELGELIGLKEVKEEINSLINLIKVKKMRESYQMPTMDITYHMVFTGNPGTGKTTVARLVAQIYKELGILSKGHLVEVDRSGLVAGFVGQTAIKVKEVIEKAIGGVLFIDEAYSLANKNDANDFGSEAIDTLVKMMEDNREDLVVIVAGYKNEMDTFLKANTGLISRFNKFIDFKDYSNEELMEILETFAEKSGVVIQEDAKVEVKNIFSNMSKEQKLVYGNGRGVRNTFENIMINQANRIVLLDMPTEEELRLIRIEDIKNVVLA